LARRSISSAGGPRDTAGAGDSAGTPARHPKRWQTVGLGATGPSGSGAAWQANYTFRWPWAATSALKIVTQHNVTWKNAALSG
jgi:hypothetical protein